MGIAERIGGIPALAAAFAVITGVLGAALGKPIFRPPAHHRWKARGFALGLAGAWHWHRARLPGECRGGNVRQASPSAFTAWWPPSSFPPSTRWCCVTPEPPATLRSTDSAQNPASRRWRPLPAALRTKMAGEVRQWVLRDNGFRIRRAIRIASTSLARLPRTSTCDVPDRAQAPGHHRRCQPHRHEQ